MTTKIEAYNANPYRSWEEAYADGSVVSIDLPDTPGVTDDTVFEIAVATARAVLAASGRGDDIKIGILTTNYKRQV